MDKDDIRKIARLGGVTLNETLRQRIKEAEQEESLSEARTASISELNKLGDQVVEKAVTVAIMDADAQAEEIADDQDLHPEGEERKAFVFAEMGKAAKNIQKEVKATADVLHRIILRKSVAEVAKQLKEWERANKPR